MIAIDLDRLLTAEAKKERAARLEKEALQRKALAFLAVTDWYVTRFAETGTPIPDDIQAERQAARQCFD